MSSLALVGRAWTQRIASGLYQAGDGVMRVAGLGAALATPDPIEVGGRSIDTVDDLVEFTGLPRGTVLKALRFRQPLSFRSEYVSTPAALRTDDWFYLSSKTYLFANAIHFLDATLTDFIKPHVGSGQRVLDFGGGSGQLTLRLAGAGFPTAFLELNSLQRDFMRFRIHRHDLSDLVEVLDPWAPVPAGSFAAVIAIDVIEHLPEPMLTLSNRLLPALAAGGVLVENSPFVANAHNPMHHDDFGLDEFMGRAGFAVTDRLPDGTRVWATGGARDDG